MNKESQQKKEREVSPVTMTLKKAESMPVQFQAHGQLSSQPQLNHMGIIPDMSPYSEE